MLRSQTVYTRAKQVNGIDRLQNCQLKLNMPMKPKLHMYIIA